MRSGEGERLREIEREREREGEGERGLFLLVQSRKVLLYYYTLYDETTF